MRITVDIEDTTLRDLQRITGDSKKAPAIQKAVRAYLREVRKKRLIARALGGETDYEATNEELEAGATYDSD